MESLELTGNLTALKESQGNVKEFHENPKNQEKVREFWSCGMNVERGPFNTDSIALSRNDFCHIFCLI